MSILDSETPQMHAHSHRVGPRWHRQIYRVKLTPKIGVARQKVHPIEVVIPRSFFGALTGGRVS
jgi:hypothetical protein